MAQFLGGANGGGWRPFADSGVRCPPPSLISTFGGGCVMKLCDYCGRENEDEAVHCRECGTQEFKKPGIAVTEAAQQSEEPEPPKSEWVVSDVPTTCEWCGRQNPAGVANCQECGTSLKRPKAMPEMRSQGPEAQQVRSQFRTLTADEMKLDLVTLMSCRTIVEADLVVAQLGSIGISAFIPDEFLTQAMAWNVNAFGYVRVQVSPKDYERAKAFLSDSSEVADSCAPSNGDPAKPLGDSGASGEPPSVS